MLKIVIDTNILIAAMLNPKGGCRTILKGALKGMYQPLMAEALFLEYEDVFTRTELFLSCPLSYEEREELLNAFLASCKWIKIYYKWRPNLQDEADNHLIELAIAGGAQIIVTNNIKDLKSGELYFEQLKILTPGDFLRR